MIYPILAYGHPVLREKGITVNAEEPGLDQLISDLWQTMQNANGCGLAANQIGKNLQLFIIDSRSTFLQLDKDDRCHFFEGDDSGTEETFINATIQSRGVKSWTDDEGCLSMPGFSHPVTRPWSVEITYYNRNFELQHRNFSGITARMIQHEHDHTQGILYPDHLPPLTRKLLAAKLKRIRDGKVRTTYPLAFYR
ncbi:peptide deformylase [Niabella beijingensis]|uniref:peptide deformylase n=1 Tax=Niabella beijingensis TaxID=2872700 RepID=UPI001CBDC85F|nr:peptide deformylase [Niabella beijingensis]MBZ4188495.1 peptide deformylase [Niabella beijingensis]